MNAIKILIKTLRSQLRTFVYVVEVMKNTNAAMSEEV